MEYVIGGLAAAIVGVIVVGVVLDRRRRGDRSSTRGTSGAEALQTRRAQREAEHRALGHGGSFQSPMGS